MNWRKDMSGSVYLVEYTGYTVSRHDGEEYPFEGAELYVLQKGRLIHAWVMDRTFSSTGNIGTFVTEIRQSKVRSVRQLVEKYRTDAERLRLIKGFDVQATKVGEL